MAGEWRSVVFIDLDGTLISGPFGPGVWPTVLAELAAKSGLAPAAIYRLIELENDARLANPDMPAVLAMDWDDIAAAVARALGVTLEADVTALAWAHAGPPHSYVLPGGEAALRALDAPDRALVVATKGLARYQKPVLDALGLTPLFDDILTPEVAGALKRDRRFFGNWPDQAETVIMVGDRYDDDVLYPAAHGFKTIWKPENLPLALAGHDPFARARLYAYAPDQPARADAIIAGLDELPETVRRLEGRR